MPAIYLIADAKGSEKLIEATNKQVAINHFVKDYGVTGKVLSASEFNAKLKTGIPFESVGQTQSAEAESVTDQPKETP